MVRGGKVVGEQKERNGGVGGEAVVVRGCGGLNLVKWVGTHA